MFPELNNNNLTIINQMKKIVSSIFMLAVISTFSMQAQKAATAKKVAPKVSVPAAKPSLKTEKDTLSYAYGAGLVEQGLDSYLKQIGVVSDSATDVVNKKNIELFIQGVKESLVPKTGQDAYNKGIGLGAQLSQMSNNFGQITGDANDKINMPAFISGFETALRKQPLLVENPNDIVQKQYMSMQEKNKAKEDQELQVKYADNIAAGQKFLEENKTKEGVVTLPDGLQYKIITEGTGPKPVASDRVKVHYHGTLIDGTVFDSSVDRGEPITLGLSEVIKGWTEVMQLMPVGSKWIAYIPYELGYGSRDAGKIKPFSTLIFEIELLEIEKADSK